MNGSCFYYQKYFSSHDFQIIRQLDLICYDSTESFSHRWYDYSNMFLLPAICVFGILTSALNLFILAKTGITENIHLYMLIGAVSDFSYLVTQVLIAWFRCGQLCPYSYSYWSKVYELYVYLYLGYVIVTFSALVDISVSIDRILLFSSNHNILSRRRFAVRCVILFITAAALVLPDYALAREIVPKGILIQPVSGIDNSTSYAYSIIYSKAMKKSWLVPSLQISLTVLSLAKGPILIGTVLIMCVILVLKLRNHQKRKNKITVTASEFSFLWKNPC